MKNISFYNLKDDEMPIGCWWGPYDICQDGYPYFLDDYYFELLKESKINFISAIPNNIFSHKDIVKKSLDLALKYNVSYFVNDPEFKNHDKDTIKNNLDLYINHPACSGVHVLDEPEKSLFDELKKSAELYFKLDISNKPLYINLLPIYGRFGDDISRKEVYKDYVESFLKEFKPQMLSFDYYCFKKREYEYGRIKLFFDNLSIIRECSLKYNVPFWSFVQAGGNFALESNQNAQVSYEYPNYPMLLWNVNANLLYGAKCIQYFTFLQPKSFAIANGELNPRTMGMIGLDGKKNVWFDYVKVCNEWIMEIDEYLMPSINLGITPIGNISKTLIEGIELIELNSNIFKSVQGSELLIGSFKYYDKDLFFILNKKSLPIYNFIKK